MKLVFVYWGYENAGSMLDLRGYTRAAQAMGHEVTVYGPPNPVFALELFQGPRRRRRRHLRLRVDDGTAVRRPFGLGAAGDAVPRQRRMVIDCDGAYNEPIEFHGDYNHRSEEEQPLLDGRLRQPVGQDMPADVRPRRSNVRPFLFHIYDPTWETPLDFAGKEFDMVYVGHTKFRWRGMSQGAARDRAGARPGRPRRAGRGGLGQAAGLDAMAESKASTTSIGTYLKRRRRRGHAAVPYRRSPSTINKGVFNPVVYRPLFERLGMVTCRTFETPAAGTIPLFLLDRDYVAEIFGERAMELVSRRERARQDPRRAGAAGALRRDRDGIRRGFRPAATPEARLRELVSFIEA